MLGYDNVYKQKENNIQMTGTLLKEVESTDDDGLIGITETEERFPLSVPTADFLVVELAQDRDDFNTAKKWTKYLDQKEEERKERFLETSPDNKYIHFFARKFADTAGPHSDRFFISYDSYVIREV